jgi:hypothetical protein
MMFVEGPTVFVKGTTVLDVNTRTQKCARQGRGVKVEVAGDKWGLSCLKINRFELISLVQGIKRGNWGKEYYLKC